RTGRGLAQELDERRSQLKDGRLRDGKRRSVSGRQSKVERWHREVNAWVSFVRGGNRIQPIPGSGECRAVNRINFRLTPTYDSGLCTAKAPEPIESPESLSERGQRRAFGNHSLEIEVSTDLDRLCCYDNYGAFERDTRGFRAEPSR